MQRVTLLFLNLFFVILTLHPHIVKGQIPAEVEKIQALAQSETWIRALHYKKNLVGNFYSILTKDFFIHPEGPSDPLLEAKAMLKQLRENSTAVCKFPYRAKILANQFGLNINWKACRKLNKWRQTLVADRISFIFASPYNGDVESLFGHLFLRFIKDDQTVASQKVLHFIGVYPKGEKVSSKILKGVSGQYKGDFRVYELINRISLYTYIERRTLYEYELNLNKSEIENLVDHAWELEYAGKINYSFTAGNCTTYMMLAFEGVLNRFTRRNSVFWMYDTPVGGVARIFQSNLVTGLRVWPALSGERRKEWKFMFNRKSKRTPEERFKFLSSRPEGKKILQKETTQADHDLNEKALPQYWPGYRQLELTFDQFATQSQMNPQNTESKGGFSVKGGFLYQEWNRAYLQQGITELELLRFHYKTYQPLSIKWLNGIKIESAPYPSWGLNLQDGFQDLKIGFALPFSNSAIYALYEHRFNGKAKSESIQSVNFQGWVGDVKILAQVRQNPGLWQHSILKLGLSLDSVKKIIFGYEKPQAQDNCKSCLDEFQSSPGNSSWISTQKFSLGFSYSI